MKQIGKWCLALICILLLNGCSDDNDNVVPQQAERERVKLAVILPQGQKSMEWNRLLNWVKLNIQQSNMLI